VALILGSGLGGLVDEIEDARRIAFTDVPGFPGASVAGHRGSIVSGRLGDAGVLAFAGRVHPYEGWSAADTVFPVRVAHAIGARTLFVSNAAGAIDRTLRAGDLMAIADHINLMWRNPLVGPVVPTDVRFPDMSEPYDGALRAGLHATARDLGIRLADGVYAAVLGPSYETPAEIRMLARLGAHAVGMSTVPEVIAARALGMRVAGISLIANPAAGTVDARLSHADVLDVAAKAGVVFRALVKAWVRRIES
jgi:purine-nucleoside phosphorylase